MARHKLNFKYSDDLLKRNIKSIQAYDLSLIYPNLDDSEQERVLFLIEIKKLSAMFIELSHIEQVELLEKLSLIRQKELFKYLENDDLKEFIEELENEEQIQKLALLPKTRAKIIHLLMSYDEDLAASIMTTEFIAINKKSTIKEATNTVVTTSKEQDYIDTIFVVDDAQKLVGVVDLKQLIIARPSHQLNDIMMEDFHFVYEYESIEKAISTVRDYDRNAIPVMTKDDRMIGIITADDVLDELIESVEYDYQKMALLNDHDNSSSAFKRSSQRLPWLLMAVFLNLIIAGFLSVFEATIIEVIALVFFQPLILGMAGNIGTQSLAVTILGIHLEEIDDQKMPEKHALKETVVGLINSLFLSASSFIIVYSFLSIVNIGIQTPLAMAIVVSLSVFASMFISAIMGFFIPLTLNRLKIDPSVASGPIITTINDIVALVIYFGVATIAFML